MALPTTDSGQPQDHSGIVPRVLLVDDDANVLKALARSLHQETMEILTTTSAAEALDIMRGQPADLLISDMRMPGMSGAELLAIVAREWPGTRRVLLTGHADLESTIQAVNEGRISNYLNKPWNEAELRQLVSELLGARLLELKNAALTAELADKNAVLEQFNATLEAQVRMRTQELNESYEHMVTLASALASQREPRGSDALLLDALMAQDIAGLLPMTAASTDALRKAVMLSGLGRLGFTDAMLSKPYSDYTPQEMQKFRQWPVLAEAALFGVPALVQASEYIRHQFERFDGAGFPDALAGEHIPLGSRILAVVRDYRDWLEGRINGTECNSAQARHEIEAQTGKRYDPQVVEAFIQVTLHYPQARAEQHELCVSSAALQEGMVLSRDLFSSRGMVLLKKHYRVEHDMIGKMQHLEQLMDEPLAIYVYRDAADACAAGEAER